MSVFPVMPRDGRKNYIPKIKRFNKRIGRGYRITSFLVQYYARKFLFLSRLRLPRLTKHYINTFPAVHLKKMDAWDYAWVLSSEFMVAALVIFVAGFNFVIFSGGQVNDQSLANKFLTYHSTQNPELYAQTASTKTLVIQRGNALVAQALASDLPDTATTPEDIAEPQIVENDNTLVVDQNVDSISELLKKQIKVYKVQPGDTLGSIARAHGIDIETIIQVNRLPGIKVDPGWELIILPRKGILVKAGPDTTLPDISNKYKCKMEDILSYNGLANEQDISEGDYIICPDGVVPIIPKPVIPKPTAKRQIGISDDSIPVSPGGHIFPKGYCTWFVAQHVKITFGGNARNWMANAKRAGYETSAAPAVGYVVQTTDDARYGHVALVTGVSDTHITVKEMNYVGFNKVSTRSIPISSKTIKGYIIPKY